MLQHEKSFSQAGQVAMVNVVGHLRTMECYTCHASWTPQCYGCHVKIDYSQGKTSFDWLAAGHRHLQPEHAADRGETHYDVQIPGELSEEWSFTRWEEPALGVNGEGRISPIAPGCQASFTVIGKDGRPIVTNRIYRTSPNVESAGAAGQLAIDMSPTQPHTMTKEARTCESCHTSDKALGYGIGRAKNTRPPNQDLIVDLETVDGHILSKHAQVQSAGIEGLLADWSQVVNESGQQVQTVGHHFRLDRALGDERARMDRQGVCLGCHQEIPAESLAVSLLHHVAEHTGQLPRTRGEHTSLIHKILLTIAWGQAAVLVGLPIVFALGTMWYIRRRRRRAG
jgi:hypothetical protein